MLKCDHCLLEFEDTRAVNAEIHGRKMTFCCHGCSGIFQLINNEGLEEFYRSRDAWTPGPPEATPSDPGLFEAKLNEAGTRADLDFLLDGIRCASCVWLNEKVLLKTEGVLTARINYATHKARIAWDPRVTSLEKVLQRIRSIGYSPKPITSGGAEQARNLGLKDLLIRFGTASFFSMQIMLFSFALYAGYFQGIDEGTKKIFHLLSFFLTLPVIGYAGLPFFTGAIRSLGHGAFSMDVLIATGTGSAFLYSTHQMSLGGEVYFDTSAMIITLILLGKYLEERARSTASETLSKLLNLPPKEARRVSGETRKMIQVSEVREGEVLEIIPGERIPLDGVIRNGSSEIDESMLTGESLPVFRTAGSEVFAGTLNLNGSFQFEVTRVGRETTLAKVVQAVEEAQSRKAPIQGATERVIGFFVPAVLLLSASTFGGWLAMGAGFKTALMNAIAVVVIACPCALGLATPLAILVGTAAFANRGILVKGGDIIETTSRIDTVFFDKTGTLTEGFPRLSFYKGLGIPDGEALRLCASCEVHSEHSIARAITSRYSGLPLYEVRNFKACPGNGIRGEINGNQVFIGTREFLSAASEGKEVDNALPSPLSEEIRRLEMAGATTVFLKYGERECGVFAISDTIRKEAKEAVHTLRKEMNIETTLITGDSKEAGTFVGTTLGLEHILGRMSPVTKAEVVRKQKTMGRRTMMIGDGINDAPSLVEADTGVSMGKATDIALESADIVLMRNDLRLVGETIRISRNIMKIIRQNIFWAFAYNAVSIPLAVFGNLHPIIAAFAMVLSSLSVVGNSLRARS